MSTPPRREVRAVPAALKRAKTRAEFVEAAVEAMGGEAEAAASLGLARAVFWQWANKSLSVEGAVVLAEALRIPYEASLQWADRRLRSPLTGEPTLQRARKPAAAGKPKRRTPGT